MSTEKRRGFSMVLFFAIGITWLYYYGKGRQEEPIDKEYTTTVPLHPKDPNDEVVAYDWANDRNITKGMADTMYLTGGKWINQSEVGTTIVVTTQDFKYNNDPSWIRPAGKESYLRQTAAGEELWRRQQAAEKRQRQKEDQALTDDDVREIVRTELDGNH